MGVLDLDALQQWEVGNQWQTLIEQEVNKESQVCVVNHNLHCKFQTNNGKLTCNLVEKQFNLLATLRKLNLPNNNGDLQFLIIILLEWV